MVVIGYEYLMKNECSDECNCEKTWLHIEPISDKHGIVKKIDICDKCFDAEARFNIWKEFLNETVIKSLGVTWEEGNELKHETLGKTILDNHSRCGDEYIDSFPLTKQQLESFGINMPENKYCPLYGGDLYYKSKSLLDIYNYFEGYVKLDNLEIVAQDYLLSSEFIQFIENNHEERTFTRTPLNIYKLMEITNKDMDEVITLLNKSNLSLKLKHYVYLNYGIKDIKFYKPQSYQNPNFVYVLMD